MQVAKDRLFLGRVLGVNMVADLGLKVRGHLGATPQQLALGPPPQVAPGETHHRDLVFGQAQQCGDLLTVRA